MIDTVKAILEMLQPWKLRAIGQRAIDRMKKAEMSRDHHVAMRRQADEKIEQLEDECRFLRGVILSAVKPDSRNEPRTPQPRTWIN